MALSINKNQIVLLSLLTAFIGMLYELVLGYGLSAIIGGTYKQYAFTVGLFTLTLGIGAFLYDLRPNWFCRNIQFMMLQFAIAFFGITAAIQTLYFGINFMPLLPEWASKICLIIPMAGIGILTGTELPWLMQGQSKKFQSILISFDFVGMFLATILFPVFLLPSLGATWVFFTAIGGNLALGCLILMQELKPQR